MRETYGWLIGVELGDYIYNGKSWLDDGSCLYEFRYAKGTGTWYCNYKEFKDYISGFDLSEYKKQSHKGYKVVDVE